MQGKDREATRKGQAMPVAVMIDRHLARGRMFHHAPLTDDSIPAVRQFLIESEALTRGASSEPARRLKAYQAALGARLKASLRAT